MVKNVRKNNIKKRIFIQHTADPNATATTSWKKSLIIKTTFNNLITM